MLPADVDGTLVTPDKELTGWAIAAVRKLGDGDRPGPGRKPGPVTRRRGAQPEAALLEAAWAELTEVGYGAFTMEGVAARAKTSRAVMYRRWSSRPELAMAAIGQYTRLAAADIPDTGTLRGDVLALLRHVSAVVGEVAGVVSFLIADYFNETGRPVAVLRDTRGCTPDSTAHVKPEHAASATRPWPSAEKPTVHTDRPYMCPCAPGWAALRRTDGYGRREWERYGDRPTGLPAALGL